jgi:hypothetical protein
MTDRARGLTGRPMEWMLDESLKLANAGRISVRRHLPWRINHEAREGV